MGIEVTGLLALIILILDIGAIVKTIESMSMNHTHKSIHGLIA